MERNPNPGEGDAGEAQAENETQLIGAQRSSEATALPKPEAKQIGDFRLGRLLGRGGMGAVYEAYQQSMRRTVALKILDSGIDPSSNELSRFEREAWIAGRLNHPNIVKALSQGVESGTHFMAMELIDGGSLASEIRSAKDDASRQPSGAKGQVERIRKMVSLFVGVADALQHVHENSIIHRDIKPQNLLLTKDSARLLLTDFGLARDEQTSQLTRRGDFLGTIRYMSPEQLLAQRAQVDRRTDIWSLGVSLYEAVTLDVPYSGASEEAYITAVSMRLPLAASARNSAVPRDLETVLMKCLERDPERRYGSAAELRDDLQRFLRDEPVLARRPGPVIKLARAGRRHRAALVAAMLSAAVLLSLVVVFVRWQRLRSEDARIRWILQQLIATRSDPEKLDPSWDRLLERLRSELRGNPTGDLAILANRAANRIEITLPSIGLLSDPPDIWFGASQVMSLGGAFLFLADLEGSLDGGPWIPIGSVIVKKAGFTMQGIRVTQYFPALSPAFHRIEVRATCRLLNAAAFSGQQLKEIFNNPVPRANSVCACGATKNPWPALRNPDKWLSTETRAVGVFPTTLFPKEYPEDFPHKVFQIPEKSIDSYFHPSRVRILRLNLPQSPFSAIRFIWPAKDKKTYCLASSEAPSDGVFGIELFGPMDKEHLPVPLAADARLYEDGLAEPVLSFPLGFGAARLGDGWYQPNWESEADDNWARLRFPAGHVARSLDVTRRSDGKGIAGHLTLTPSRSVALATRDFDSYYARPLSIPVQIEIQTVTAEAVDVKSCQPRP
jgi:serine/threonine protein kinase